MLLLALILVPAVAAALAYLFPALGRRVLLVGTAVVHLALVLLLWATPGDRAFGGWLAEDALGRIILTLVSVLFVAVAHYAVGYLREETTRAGRAFVTCMLGFLAAATLVTLSHHFVLLWIGMESTTLAVAPLIYHRHDRRSLEAVWKYLVLSSVGIAFALLGVFLLATAQPSGAAGGRPLVLDDMIAHAGALDPVWLRAAFVFVLIGFGSKMGIAPLHAWKPDVYGVAPGLVSALMAGALTSCAFLGLARVVSICFAASIGDFVRPALIGFGLLSIAIAAAFMIGQADVKRLLAYSSVEHMGLLILALGLGGAGSYGAILHALNNGLAKVMVFLAVGNVVLAAGTSSAHEIRGVLRRMPGSGILLVVGLFAVTGSPPFGMFISEYTIISAAIGEHYPWVAAAVLVLLSIIFVAMAAMILEMVYGEPGEPGEPREPAAGHTAPRQLRDRARLVTAPMLLAVVVLALGVYLPRPLTDALSSAANALGGRAP
ncbi:MAG TPA: proton-conducting transporter membrane subunit [Gemmatimonadaceae bacterium]|jgi:hydrogenase-4 component F